MQRETILFAVLSAVRHSGYQAAILAELAGFVVTMERHGELARQAASRLKVHCRPISIARPSSATSCLHPIFVLHAASNDAATTGG